MMNSASENRLDFPTVAPSPEINCHLRSPASKIFHQLLQENGADSLSRWIFSSTLVVAEVARLRAV
jgi:hypothetical protein